jgi:cytochrome c oxidase assembly protein subunit 15
LLALVGGLLVAQILLGALTVWKLLDPTVVGGHLAVALLLFCSILTVTLVAEREAQVLESGDGPDSAAIGERLERPGGLLALLAGATMATYAQAVLGGIVSSHGAGLACPDWPTCNGAWFPPLEGLVGLQMIHRYGAYALVGLIGITAWRAGLVGDPALKAGGRMALVLTGAQVTLGICNVLLRTPVWLSAAHLATAAAMLGLLVTLTLRAAAMPVEGRVPDPVLAR